MVQWKVIPNYSKYEVSTDGRIRHADTQQEITPNVNGGYKCVNLYRDDGKKVLEKLHRCVALTFIPKPEGSCKIVLHKDEDRMNNNVSNLQWKINGKVNDCEISYTTMFGKKYRTHILEALAARHNLPLYGLIQRTRMWPDKGLKYSLRGGDRYVVDGIIGYGRDGKALVYSKKQAEKNQKRLEEQLMKERLEAERILELEKKEEQIRQRFEYLGTKDASLIKEANRRFLGIYKRCYNPLVKSYNRYGGSGVSISSDWLNNRDSFIRWYVSNHIEGWEMDKDILSLGKENKVYSTESCCFIPKELNLLFSGVRGFPKPYLQGERFKFDARPNDLDADTYEELFDKYIESMYNKLSDFSTLLKERNADSRLIAKIDNIDFTAYVVSREIEYKDRNPRGTIFDRFESLGIPTPDFVKELLML